MKACIASILMLFTTISAQARLMQGWSNQQLFDKSDLVVIATPTSSSDTKERTGLPGLTAQQVIGVETGFTVSAIMKGDKELKTIVLHHYRAAPDGALVPNGPTLLSFTPGDQRTLLLYLVREADGRYAPTVGQTDPGYYGINVVGTYSPAEKPASTTEDKPPAKEQVPTEPGKSSTPAVVPLPEVKVKASPQSLVDVVSQRPDAVKDVYLTIAGSTVNLKVGISFVTDSINLQQDISQAAKKAGIPFYWE